MLRLHTIYLGLWVIALSCALADGSTSRTVRFGDGEKIKHYYLDGVPEMSENQHAAVELAGYQLTTGENGLSWRWSFTLALKAQPPVLITVSDVTTSRAVIIIDSTQGYFTDKRWFGQSETFRPNSSKLPWLYESGTSQRVFRLDMALPDNKHKILYQPAIYTQESKKKIRRLIDVGTLE